MIRYASRFLLALLLAAPLGAQFTTLVGPGRTDGGSGIAPPPTHLRIDAFTADGTWTAPAGVTSALVELWAPGGTGANDTGAGGGGEYCRAQVAVVPATGYAIVVGNTAGENSTFNSTTVVAVAGVGGASGGAGGTGGTGDTCFAGGNGAVGTGNQAGGGGAGDQQVGSNATGNTVAPGGNYFGGWGHNSGTFQYAYGGGGRSQTGSSAAGAIGHARVTYSVDPGAGFPAVTARSWGRTAADTTSHVVNLPACASGNYLLAILGIDAGPTLSGYAGWTAIAEPAHGTVKAIALYKVSTGSDSLTITSSTSDGSTHFSMCIAGATAAPDATGATGASANSNPPGHTHGGGSKKMLWIAAVSQDTAAQGVAGGQDVSAPPANYDSFLFMSGAAITVGADTAIAARHLEAETEDPGTFTSANDEWVAITIAVPGS